ncbi:efflux RND transporter periplasmic adaptor subunit [Nonomuraea soli]|uniref:Macrolide-specific efflux system membrane fusion protein n=1 Tax=Nonomuraea soli TaxID=1032476 RepID=A0A7W0CF63_9ACTN|nr:efflux RND transporter periplasmic adaptor subunit [Nonomuraea soli]MBA2889889.1 macrolide-specific efflux system membrane fusion protein [Nonomuraea soli]
MKFRRRGLLINGALGILLLGGAGAIYNALGLGGATQEAAVRTVAASRGTVVASVSASGSVESAQTRSLSFDTSGTVEKIYVQVGDKVSKGQILARLDDDSAREGLEAALADYQAAAEDSGSSAAAYASYVKARIAYREAQREVAGTVLKAPFGGTITALNGTVGGSSSGGSVASTTAGSGASTSGGSGASTGGSTGFLTVTNTAKLQLTGNFTETDVARLKVGQEATVTFDALSGVSGKGEITQIEPVSATSNNVVQYPVTVAFTEVPKQVKLGQTATVSVEVGRAADVIALASSAITTAGGQSTVTLLKNGRQVRTPVTLGVKGTVTTEIRSGLSEGDQVVPPATTTTTGQQGNQMRGFGGGGGFTGGGGQPPGGGGR